MSRLSSSTMRRYLLLRLLLRRHSAPVAEAALVLCVCVCARTHTQAHFDVRQLC